MASKTAEKITDGRISYKQLAGKTGPNRGILLPP